MSGPIERAEKGSGDRRARAGWRRSLLERLAGESRETEEESAPPTPTVVPLPRITPNRYYCPKCGEVHSGAGNKVYPHRKSVAVSVSYATSSPFRSVWCGGGRVTEKDKAP